jgi:hypothetical protein
LIHAAGEEELPTVIPGSRFRHKRREAKQDVTKCNSLVGLNPNSEVETASWAARLRWSAAFTPQKAWLE